MNNKIKIPVSFVFEMDDVGWDNGRDLRIIGQASRSGIPRNHALEDYEFLNRLSKVTGKNVAAALCLADWDKDNFLRGEKGITHNPDNWDRKSEIDTDLFSQYRNTLEEGHVDYMVHGIMHGRYTDEGKMINEHEFYEYERLPDGSRKKEIFSEDDFRRRLDLFFKIYNSWGFKQKIKGFVVPCGLPYDEEIQRKICKILREYGIIYWADNFTFPETLKVMEGVALFKWSHNGGRIPWDAYDFDPSVLGNMYDEEATENSCLRGTHWTNFLRFNPANNIHNVEPWAKYYESQAEVFGCALANNLAEGVNQLFYHEFANMSFENNQVTVDLEEVKNQKLECHKNEFLISFKKELKPTSCAGGEMALYETHKEFNTYKITHNDNLLKISFE